eukprot:scaffold151775_cov18-Tisochrysis_lutea.AAC.1
MLPTVLVVQFIYRCMLSTRVRQAVPAGGHFRASRWGLLFRTDLLSGPSFMHVPGHKLCKLFVSSTCCNTCVLQVWEEGSSSEAGAVRLYAPEIVTLLVEGLGSQQWGRKQASAQAVVRLTELGHDLLNGSTSATGTAEGADAGGASSSSPACVLAEALLAEAGGRLWDGKESVLQALAALAKSAPGVRAVSSPGKERTEWGNQGVGSYWGTFSAPADGCCYMRVFMCCFKWKCSTSLRHG